MPKRFHSTEIWTEDWFIDLSSEEKFLWLFILDDCDHAGIWKPNKRMFETSIGGQVDLSKALKNFNSDKIRIEVLPNGRWFILDFLIFQYGSKLNSNNRMHLSIIQLLKINEVKETSIRPLIEDIDTPKDKDKDNNKNNVDEIPYDEIISYLNSKTGQKYHSKSNGSRKHISARWKEGHRLEDFKKAIDNMTSKWLNDPKMCQYLRPSTLFASEKFDGYVNQIVKHGDPGLCSPRVRDPGL